MIQLKFAFRVWDQLRSGWKAGNPFFEQVTDDDTAHNGCDGCHHHKADAAHKGSHDFRSHNLHIQHSHEAGRLDFKNH